MDNPKTSSEKELDHMGGNGVVAKHWFAKPGEPGKAYVFTSLPNEEELDAWQEAAFTNGGPLVKIELIWAPDEARSLEEEVRPSDGGGA